MRLLSYLAQRQALHLTFRFQWFDNWQATQKDDHPPVPLCVIAVILFLIVAVVLPFGSIIGIFAAVTWFASQPDNPASSATLAVLVLIFCSTFPGVIWAFNNPDENKWPTW